MEFTLQVILTLLITFYLESKANFITVLYKYLIYKLNTYRVCIVIYYMYHSKINNEYFGILPASLKYSLGINIETTVFQGFPEHGSFLIRFAQREIEIDLSENQGESLALCIRKELRSSETNNMQSSESYSR